MLFSDRYVVHVGELCDYKWSYVVGVLDVDLTRPSVVIVFPV